MDVVVIVVVGGGSGGSGGGLDIVGMRDPAGSGGYWSVPDPDGVALAC